MNTAAGKSKVALGGGFLILLILSGILTGVVEAQKNSARISLKPGQFEFLIEPGQGAIGKSVITNQGQLTTRFKLIVQDFRQIDQKGSLEFFVRDEFSTQKWIVPEFLEVGLLPGQSKEIRFVVMVPKNVPAGDYYGAILFEPVNGFPPLKKRLALFVLITVSGEGLKKEGRLLDFKVPFVAVAGPIKFNFLFENTGSVYLKPEMTLTVSDLKGKEITKANLKRQVVYAGTIRQFEGIWQSPKLFGLYQAKIGLKSSEKVLEKTVWFLIVPGVVLDILFLMLIFLGLYFRKEIFQKISGLSPSSHTSRTPSKG